MAGLGDGGVGGWRGWGMTGGGMAGLGDDGWGDGGVGGRNVKVQAVAGLTVSSVRVEGKAVFKESNRYGLVPGLAGLPLGQRPPT